ncbi:hypothetical protein chiPu_0031062 [Chiloscyllium punctatum]|uniref:Uncharacterized protein n=1 Tax=Chiloscyllium punctatum TaxID=137246 RepID=A0A401TVX5_CHIPU|nr:hypothetical protein [Chiloscyllium punctatum]
MQQRHEFRLPMRAGLLEDRLELIARGGKGNAGFLCGGFDGIAARKPRGEARLRRGQLERRRQQRLIEGGVAFEIADQQDRARAQER